MVNYPGNYGSINTMNNPYYPNSYVNQLLNNNVPKMDIIKVSGRNGAEAFQMQPNSSVLLLDDTNPIVWLKTTDGAGYPTLTPYTISLYQPEPEISAKSLEERISRIEEMLNNESNIKSNEYADRNATNDATNTEDKAGNEYFKKRK